MIFRVLSIKKSFTDNSASLSNLKLFSKSTHQNPGLPRFPGSRGIPNPPFRAIQENGRSRIRAIQENAQSRSSLILSNALFEQNINDKDLNGSLKDLKFFTSCSVEKGVKSFQMLKKIPKRKTFHGSVLSLSFFCLSLSFFTLLIANKLLLFYTFFL